VFCPDFPNANKATPHDDLPRIRYRQSRIGFVLQKRDRSLAWVKTPIEYFLGILWIDRRRANESDISHCYFVFFWLPF
jgi:hypothetical protein